MHLVGSLFSEDLRAIVYASHIGGCVIPANSLSKHLLGMIAQVLLFKTKPR